MIDKRISIRVDVGPWRSGLALAVFCGDDVAKTLEFTEAPRHARCEPTVELDFQAAQVLMDDLYHAGIRPSEGDSPGELKATKQHLQDMKAIAFKKLGMDK